MVDKPVIQYVVEEAAASGIRDILMIVSRGKRAVEEHFDRNVELEGQLDRHERSDEAERLRAISNLANIHFMWQQELNGLGDAVLHARDHVGNEPFAVLLGDTIIDSPAPATLSLIAIRQCHGGSVLALEETPMEKLSRYGVIAGKACGDRLHRIHDLVEKPGSGLAPSNLAIAGRYVLTPEIFEALERQPVGLNGEIQLTDALRSVAAHEPLWGLEVTGRRHDVGNPLDYLKTSVLLALKHEKLGPDFRRFLADLT